MLFGFLLFILIYLVKMHNYKRTNNVWFHLLEVPRVVKFMELAIGMLVVMGQEEGNGQLLFYECTVSVLQNKEFCRKMVVMVV